ncbi:RNA binding protein [Oryctes borbonicus]|uniref:RNA binding protein n=1 Tax=Oryctes borbonicus TaxID=1629725 RepID=A0A0T6AWE5_9SCAR|nr:RNA binding protein [Oryctes borbonicus]
MRRKSTRTSGKLSPEKGKQTDSPVAKSRRTTRRRRKSTSESEHSEDEPEIKHTTEQEGTSNLTNPTRTSLDTETNAGTIEKKLLENKEEPMEKHEKKIKLKRNRSSGTHDGIDTNTEDKYSSRRTRRRGSPKMEDKSHREDDGDDRKGKGKSKGKTKSTKIEKSQPPNEFETHNESDISTNAQVTPQSPQIVNTNLMVDNEVDVAENAEENKSSETDRNEEDRTGDTDTKGKKSITHDEHESTEIEENNIRDDRIENDEIAENKTAELDESQNKKESNCLNSSESNETAVSAVENSENTGVDKSATNDAETTNEIVQIESSQPETDDGKIKSDEDFAGFAKNDQSTSKDASQFTEEPMDISMDVTFSLKTEDSSINITEAEETIDNNETQHIPNECAPSEDDNRSKTPEKLPEKVTYGRKITVRRATGSKSEGPREKGWGTSSIYLDMVTHVNIDTEMIQNIYSNVQFLDESEVKLDIDTKARRRSLTDIKDRKRLERNISNESEGRKYDTQTDEKEPEEDNANIIAINRKISIVDDSASKLKPPPSPAKNPTSSVLFITNLVRPFTLKQLKELLERTGKIKENCFWTDRIKSKCYVQYENVLDAEATRNALHGVHWPIGNGKKLVIDYGTEDDLENAKNPPATPPIPEPTMKIEKENEEPIKKQEEEEKVREKLKEKRRNEHVREWDVGKTELHRGRSHSRTRDRSDKRKHSRHSPSPFEDYIARKQKKADDQVPQKMMDDLFQKTKTTPSIYWQPLSPEEIATKQQQRLERMAEHKRRLEESTRNRAEFGRGAPYRRRYD